MSIAKSLLIVTSLSLAAGCSYNRHPGYSTATYGGDVVVPPAVSADEAADLALAEQVRQQFNHYGDLANLAPYVQVNAHHGKVTLDGTVPTEQQRKMIDGMVESTPGVLEVTDHLKVSGLPVASVPAVPANSVVAERVRTAILNQPEVAQASPNILVTEQDGAVTLTGQVPTEHLKYLIETAARNTPGVVVVYDNIAIGYPPAGRANTVPGDAFNLHVEGLSAPDRALAERILEGLRTDRKFSPMPPSVNINVSGGRVILTGTVQSEQQRQTIVSSVQHAAGYQNVDDQLQVLGH